MTYKNKAYFPTACSDPVLDDRTVYNTLVRIAPVNKKVGKAVAGVFLHYGWTVAGMLYENQLVCLYGAVAIQDSFATYNISVAASFALPLEMTDAEIDSYLLEIAAYARSRQY